MTKFFLLIIISVFINSSYAQNIKKIYRYISKNEFVSANDELMKSEGKLSKESEILFELSKVIINDNIYDEPYITFNNFNNVIIDFNHLNKDESLNVKEFLSKYNLSFDSIKSCLILTIVNYAKQKNTELDYKKALTVCNETKYKEELMVLQENSTYEKCEIYKNAGLPLKSIYIYYLDNYKENSDKNFYNKSHYNQIQSLCESLEFKEAKDNHELLELNLFIKKYPNSHFLSEVKMLIEKRTLEVKELNDYRDITTKYKDFHHCLKFIEDYPKSNYISEVKAILKKLNPEYTNVPEYISKDSLIGYWSFEGDAENEAISEKIKDGAFDNNKSTPPFKGIRDGIIWGENIKHTKGHDNVENSAYEFKNTKYESNIINEKKFRNHEITKNSFITVPSENEIITEEGSISFWIKINNLDEKLDNYIIKSVCKDDISEIYDIEVRVNKKKNSDGYDISTAINKRCVSANLILNQINDWNFITLIFENIKEFKADNVKIYQNSILLKNTDVYSFFDKDDAHRNGYGDVSRGDYDEIFYRDNRNLNGFDYLFFGLFSGALDDLSIWNRILTQDEIKNIYNKVPIIKTNNNSISYNSIQKTPNLEIKNLVINDNNKTLEANETSKISFYIKNTGKGNAKNIITSVKNNSDISGIIFLKIDAIYSLLPNDSIKIDVPFHGDLELSSGEAKIKISFEEANGFPPDPIEVSIKTKEFIKPNIKVVDYSFNTENGVIKQAALINLKTIIQNIGQGDGTDIRIKFILPASNIAPISENEISISSLKAGESKEVNFEFMVNKLYTSTTVPIKIEIDEINHKFFENKEVFTTLNSSSNITSVKVESNYQEKKIAINEVSLTSDVDKNIPINSINYPNRYALIIGNEDYSSKQPSLNTESNVEFAVNDAKSFRDYAINVLGIPKENCFLVLNGTTGEMTQKINVISQILTKLGDKGELIFYYAGHGFPDEVTKTPYLIPVDVSGTNLQSAIKVTDLYKKFTDTKANRITIFLDACFTGGGRDQGLLAARGVKLKPEIGFLSGNITIFTATSEIQSALPYKEKQHGMFTYYLLKKLQETKGNLTYLELQNYIKEQVSIQSLKVNSKTQDPQINVSPDVISVWGNWKFN